MALLLGMNIFIPGLGISSFFSGHASKTLGYFEGSSLQAQESPQRNNGLHESGLNFWHEMQGYAPRYFFLVYLFEIYSVPGPANK